jgi:hypothetical protein
MSTLVDGICVPPGTPGLPFPTTVPPVRAISGNAARWLRVTGAVGDDLASVNLICPVESRPTRSTGVRTPLSVFTVSLSHETRETR